MHLLKKYALLSGLLAITTFSSSVLAHTFSFKDPNNKHKRDYLIVSIYNSTDDWMFFPREIFNVPANSSVPYVEDNDGPIRVHISTSMPGFCPDAGACSPHGMYNVDLRPGENVTCEINEQTGMFENNLVCYKVHGQVSS